MEKKRYGFNVGEAIRTALLMEPCLAIRQDTYVSVPVDAAVDGRDLMYSLEAMSGRHRKTDTSYVPFSWEAMESSVCELLQETEGVNHSCQWHEQVIALAQGAVCAVTKPN